MTQREELERLRDAFGSGEAGAPPEPHRCPTDRQIWEAAQGLLPVQERRRLVLHTSQCGPCSESWRLAYHLGPGSDTRRVPAPLAGLTHRILTGKAAAVAAGLLLLAGLASAPFIAPFFESPPSTRGSSTYFQFSTRQTALRRDRFDLDWPPARVPAGERAVYELVIRDVETGREIDRARISSPGYRIPESKLTGLATGARVFCNLEALLADGTVVENTSEIFSIR